MSATDLPMGEPEDWIRVADAADLAAESAIEVVVAGELVAVFRHQGKLFALEALCAHHGGPLAEGALDAGCVTCPWHGWTYRLESGTQAHSGEPLLRAFPVREREGGIEIGWSERPTRG
jgi:nitrite reductase/ring-hydroxylating ferredoxin subunit